MTSVLYPYPIFCLFAEFLLLAFFENLKKVNNVALYK
jgi:hypothetical protein